MLVRQILARITVFVEGMAMASFVNAWRVLKERIVKVSNFITVAGVLNYKLDRLRCHI